MEKSNDNKVTSKRMSSIKGQNTKVELKLRKLLWKEGYRYRIKSKIIGKPDIVFHSKKIVVFVDGDFWHGFDFNKVMKKKFNNKLFWIQKIKRNMIRDKKVNDCLKKQGYTVIRIWEHEINRNLDSCLLKITIHLKD